jgi:hypothetical protein
LGFLQLITTLLDLEKTNATKRRKVTAVLTAFRLKLNLDFEILKADY